MTTAITFSRQNDAGSRASNTQYWENLFLVVVLISEFQGDVTQDDSQRWFLVQHGVAVLEQCCNPSKQCRNNIATLCCAKNRRYESSRVTSPLNSKLSIIAEKQQLVPCVGE